MMARFVVVPSGERGRCHATDVDAGGVGDDGGRWGGLRGRRLHLALCRARVAGPTAPATRGGAAPKQLMDTALPPSPASIRASPPLAVLFALMTLPLAAAASAAPSLEALPPDCAVSLAAPWKFQAGDDSAWAGPGFDDSGWDQHPVPTGWGFPRYDGELFWYRTEIQVDPVCGRSSNRPLGLTIGKVDSAYELYVGGAPLGRVGSLPPMPRSAHDRRQTYAIPEQAVDPEGRLVVALRVWKSSETRGSVGHLYEGPFLLGPYHDLLRRELLSELPTLFLAGIFLLLAALHLLLYWRRRPLSVYLWFAASALLVAGYTFLQTQWKYTLTDRFLLLKELEYLALYLLVAAFVQLAWSLMGLRVSRLLRGVQLVYVAAGVAQVLTPGLGLNGLLLPYGQIGIVALAVAWLWVVVREAWRKNPEAHVVAVGAIVSAAAFLSDIAVNRGLYAGPRMSQYGFAVLVISMALSLSDRFSRIHAELDALRRDLEQRVAERTRELVEANRAKSQFLATMSHEIRTPLNGVIGMMELLAQTRLGAEQRELVDVARESGEALLAIVNDVLDFSKSEAGKLVLHTTDLDLTTTLEEVIASFADRAHQKGVELAHLVDEGVPARLRGDPARLRQVLTNLVGNAVKFTEKGQVVVRLGLADEDADQVRVRFEVMDTGIGISAADRERLFRSFSQLDGSASRSFGGTGLGLAISKQIVELMGGEVGVDSEEGRGSTFWFTARFEKASGPPAERSDRLLVGQKVLVVADSATGGSVLERHLAARGIETRGARDGPEALRLLRAASGEGRPFAVALLDRQTPGMDGLELARAIRGEPALARTSLVLVSPLGRRGEAAEAERAGFDGYLSRPVRTSDLLGCLEELVREPASEARPLVTRHSLAKARAVVTPVAPSVAPTPLRILLAEDNPVNQVVAIEMLRHLGYGADLAENGHEALAALERQAYDVVLLDVQMPELDGLATARHIRRRWPRGSGPRLVAMTANVMAGDREECLAAGMDDYVGKPVRASELAAALARGLLDSSGDAGSAEGGDARETAV